MILPVSSSQSVILVGLYRAIRLRFGYGFELCDANSPAKRQKHKPCATKARLCFPTSPCWQSGIGLESAETRTISRCDLCETETLRFVCPKSIGETDGMAAKLLRCGMASDALRRNMPLRFQRKLRPPNLEKPQCAMGPKTITCTFLLFGT